MAWVDAPVGPQDVSRRQKVIMGLRKKVPDLQVGVAPRELRLELLLIKSTQAQGSR